MHLRNCIYLELIEFDKFFDSRVVSIYRRKKVLWYCDAGSIPADW